MTDMNTQILSQSDSEVKSFQGANGIISTNVGLVKSLNEDAVGYLTKEDGLTRIAIADGHWGPEAASACVEFWMNDSAHDNPLASMEELEALLAKRFAMPSPDPETTKTSESSTLTVTIYPDKRMTIIGYGDCRMCVVRDGVVIYRYTTSATWIGLFSSLGLRGRIPAKTGTVVESVLLQSGDTIVMYTDGVDECVYEVPTLSVEDFVRPGLTPMNIHDAIMDAVFQHGAEDNATLAILKVV